MFPPGSPSPRSAFQAIAYPAIAGLPTETRLYAGILPLVALFGPSQRTGIDIEADGRRAGTCRASDLVRRLPPRVHYDKYRVGIDPDP